MRKKHSVFIVLVWEKIRNGKKGLFGPFLSISYYQLPFRIFSLENLRIFSLFRTRHLPRANELQNWRPFDWRNPILTLCTMLCTIWSRHSIRYIRIIMMNIHNPLRLNIWFLYPPKKKTFEFVRIWFLIKTKKFDH